MLSSITTLPRVPIEQLTLANGLRVVLSHDASAPVVSVAVYYDVGSRNERTGRTGFAHLFEHMMFQGSENVPKAGHFQFIFNAGGTMNGTTSSERTNYFQTLPANQLPLALWLESDRMRSLKVTQENLDNQRSAVQEEKRLNYDNRPYSNAFLRLNELVFTNPANAHSTIGSMEDLDAATLEDVQEFFRIYYAPNNAVLSIVGDFDPTVARQLIDRYFATISSQPAPPAVDVSEEPEVAGHQEIYKDRFAQLPALMMAWKIPPRRTDDFYALSLAGNLLLEGDSSRLYQKLVKDDAMVVAIQGGVNTRRGPSSLTVFAIPKPDVEANRIRQAVSNEIKQLASAGPTGEEMEKLRNNLLNDAVRARQSTLYRAQRLAEFALYDGDPNIMNTELDHYLNVTPAQIRESVACHLDTTNQSVMEIVPAPEQGRPEVVAAASTSTQLTNSTDAITPVQPGAPPPQIPQPPEAQLTSSTVEEITEPDGGAAATTAAQPRPEQPQQ